ncbi:hypothetical protein KSP40_PGU005592 [Platanthera guangdongensis]|uniref:Uncharacterized protein n=1 Tax=Platanthera guangdongensis TaxID=2320717 RepID=A0ABR2MC24_9ASPA
MLCVPGCPFLRSSDHCYHDKSAVTDELVQIILQPGLDSREADVFLEFICNSDGPLPEELLPEVKVFPPPNIVF